MTLLGVYRTHYLKFHHISSYMKILFVIIVDMNNLSCLEETRKRVELLCGNDGINLLINNAGNFLLRF